MLDQSRKEHKINTKYGKCFTESIGDMLSNGDVKRDQNGNVRADNSLCSPKSLGPHNPKYGDLVFRWRLAHNYNNTLDQLGQMQEVTTSGGAGGATPSGSFTNPFPDGWTPGRLDMGYDGTFKNKIVAPFDGKILYAATGVSTWGGYIELKADTKPSGLPTSTLYFAEGIKPTVHNGQKVVAGDTIATPDINIYNGTSGNIEWGVSEDAWVGSYVGTYAVALGGSGKCAPTPKSKAMVLDFYQWAKSSLQVPGNTTDTSCAGSP